MVDSASWTTTVLTNGWITYCCIAISFQLFRLSIDFIQTASQKTSKDFVESHHKVQTSGAALKDKGDKKDYGTSTSEEQALLVAVVAVEEDGAPTNPIPTPALQPVPSRHRTAVWSFRVQLSFCLLLLVDSILDTGSVLPSLARWSAFCVVGFGAWLTVRDLPRRRLGLVSRLFYLGAALTLWLPICIHYYKDRSESVTGDEIVVNVMGLYVLLTIAECFFLDWPYQLKEPRTALDDTAPKKKTLSRAAILVLLKPYFWPEETAESASVNRFRAIMTWICVILSKICNLSSPMFLGWASTALAHEDYWSCMLYSMIYAAIQFFGAAFKEGQSLIYLKVAQAAFVQLSETTFEHLHSLSLDWHFRKKLGEVIRSMDRGIAAW